MFGIGGNELILILLFGFLIFGPDKLPAMAKTIGQVIAKFRNAQNEMNQVLKNEVFDPTAENPFKNPLDVAAKLEAAAKKEDRQESFSQRKARYDKQRAARKRAEERKAELAAQRAEKEAAEAGGDVLDVVLAADRPAEAKSAPSEESKPTISADELYGIQPKTKRPKSADAAAESATAIVGEGE